MIRYSEVLFVVYYTELDKIQIIKELLCVMYVLFDVSQTGFMPESLCIGVVISTNFLSVLFVQFHMKHISL